MKAYVYVSLKKSVLDPQGKTIQGALKKMGYKGLEQVRQGKYFELTLEGGLNRQEAQSEVERIAREVLTNPVMEEFHCSLADLIPGAEFLELPHVWHCWLCRQEAGGSDHHRRPA